MKSKIFATDEKRGMYAVLDIRGWGYFTGLGHGALGLQETEAIARMEANADFILTACNSHYELVEALKGLLCHSGIADVCGNDKDKEDHALERQARAAISKAKAGE